MSHKLDKAAKQVKDKHQVILNDLLREEANRYCADCEAKGPRWASWNLGVFLCIRCAGIHRNLGVHISRVKSVNLDSWTAAQMESIQSWGNKRAKEYYECYLPTDFLRPQGDSAMETLIRNKYERKLYIRKGGEPPKNKLKDQTEQIKPQGRDKQQENKQEKMPRIAAEKKIPQKSSPQQPKITSVSRPSGSNVQQPKPKAPQTVDLLGMDAGSEPAPQQTLNQSQDEFSLFMGAAPISNQNSQSQIGNIPPQASQSKNSSQVQNGSSLLLEEMATTKANTKESILSLYQSGSQQQKQMFGVPGGVYMPQQQAPGFGIQGSSQKQMMGPAQHPVGINQQGMKMNQPQAPVGQYQFGMNQQQMGMNQQQMGMNQQQMGMNQQQIGMNQQQMGMNQHQAAGMNQRQMGIMSQQAGMHGNFVGMTQNNFGANTNANMVNSNVRMQTSQPGMSNMMAMQNQMQNMNLGQNSQSNQFYNSNNQMMNKQNSAQFAAANFQVNLGQNLMATGYGGNKPMMPSQQPILANGPAVGMGFANANMGMSQNMGHTLNNQLWK